MKILAAVYLQRSQTVVGPPAADLLFIIQRRGFRDPLV